MVRCTFGPNFTNFGSDLSVGFLFFWGGRGEVEQVMAFVSRRYNLLVLCSITFANNVDMQNLAFVS